ncbi:MAG: hypothetical protein R2681_01755 [Pyrinomonadaceae bacterium]
MRSQNLLFIFIFTITLFLLGCPGEEPSTPSNNGDVSESNLNSTQNNASNTNNPLKTEAEPPRTEEKVAETLKPVVDSYCAALKKGDDTALKSVYSQATWSALTADAKSEGKSVSKYLKDSEPIGNQCKVINERIAGNVAEAIVITQTYPAGVPLKFVKENGNWKMTNQSSDFEAVRKNSKN